MEKVCIVHDRRYLSKFHESINQLRQSNEFDHSILRRLPKRCCSCGEKDGLSSLTIDDLRKICGEIQAEPVALQTKSPPRPVKPTHFLVLDYPSTLTSIQRMYKQGRFIGRGGKNIRPLEHKLNVRINLLNTKSNRCIRETINEFQKQNDKACLNGLTLLITLNNDKNDWEKIKQSIIDAWNSIKVTEKKRTGRVTSVEALTSVLASISKDTRWKPAKSKAKDKYKRKSKQNDELEVEVEPQPVLPPISMPREIPKHQKNKRK